MANISGKINLTKLDHAISKTGRGAEIIIIPIKQNHLFKSDKGNVFLDISLWEQEEGSKGKEFGDFHIIQSLPKEVREEMKKFNEDKDKSEKKYAPSLGNASYIGVSDGQVEPTVMDTPFEEGSDDLPF